MILDLMFDHPWRDSELEGQFADFLLIQHVAIHTLSQAGGRREELRGECAPLLLPIRAGGR